MMSNHTKQTEEEFELFWTARCCGLGIECVLTRLINGDYCDIKAYYAWIGWSERQKSMKAIKLPDSKIYRMAQHGMTQMIDLNDTKDAITLAGYKVE